MKIALVHDQLCEFGGSERVLVALKKIFPQADIFTLTYNQKGLGAHQEEFKKWNIKTSWFGKIPIIKHYYSPFRFLTPLIWESFNFSKYDLVISSSGSWMSKGIKTKKPTLHISYIHHPPRYLYGYETAIEWQKYFIVKLYAYVVNHFLRIWDYESSQRPDFIITNSQETRSRIKKFYRRDSTVIYPPVEIPNEIKNFKFKIKNYYIIVSRLARAKHVDIVIKAANKLKFNLKVVGSGRDEERLRQMAGPTVEILNKVNDKSLHELYKNARAFLFASKDEEFGIAPIEAMSYGLPVIAYNSGGLKETVTNGQNGFLFNDLNENSLIEKIKLLGKMPEKDFMLMKRNAHQSSEKYSFFNFKKQILEFVKKHARTT